MDTTLFLEQFGHLATSAEGVDKLRGLVLDLAVRGKLVQQSDDDEPAHQLMQQMEAEKHQLHKAGEIKKPKKLPEIEAEEIQFSVPSNWSWVRINELTVNIQTGPFGSNLHKREYINGGIPLINPSNMIDGKIVPNPDWTVGEDTYERLITYAVDEGDLVMARRGEMGRCAVVTVNEAGWLCGTGSLILKASTCIDRPFLWLLFQSGQVRSYLEGESVGSTMNNLSQKTLLRMPIPLPPLAEQKRIVARVDELMHLCDQLEAELDEQRHLRERAVKSTLFHLTGAENKAEALAYWQQAEAHFNALFDHPVTVADLRAAILQLAVQGRLVPQHPDDEPASALLRQIAAEKQRLYKAGEIKKPKKLPPIAPEEIPYELPAGWEWVRLGNLSDKITDGEHQTPPRQPTGFPLLSAKNVRDGYIRFDNHDLISEEDFIRSLERCNAETGDVVMVSVGATIGRCALVRDEPQFALVRSVALIKTTFLYSEYLHYALKSPFLQGQIGEVKRGGAQPVLYLGRINSLVIPFPPPAEQQRIAEKVNELMMLCDQLEAEATHTGVLASRLTDSVIYHLLNGHGAG